MDRIDLGAPSALRSTNQATTQPTTQQQATMTKPGKQPAKKTAAEGDTPKATIDKGSQGRKDLEELYAAMTQNLAGGKRGSGGATKSKPRTELVYSLDWTVHASTGQKGKNLIVKFPIFAWEKDMLKGMNHDGRPVRGHVVRQEQQDQPRQGADARGWRDHHREGFVQEHEFNDAAGGKQAHGADRPMPLVPHAIRGN